MAVAAWLSWLLFCVAANVAAESELFVSCESGKLESNCTKDDPCKSLAAAVLKLPPVLPATIWVAAGEVCVEQPLLLPRGQLTISGDRGQALLFFSNSNGITVSSASLQLRNLALTGAKIALHATNSNLSIRNCTFRDGGRAVVSEVDGTRNISLDFVNSTFAWLRRSGIQLEGLRALLPARMDVLVSHCLFVDNIIDSSSEADGLIDVSLVEDFAAGPVGIANTHFIRNVLRLQDDDAPSGLVDVQWRAAGVDAVFTDLLFRDNNITSIAELAADYGGALLNVSSRSVVVSRCAFENSSLVLKLFKGGVHGGLAAIRASDLMLVSQLSVTFSNVQVAFETVIIGGLVALTASEEHPGVVTGQLLANNVVHSRLDSMSEVDSPAVHGGLASLTAVAQFSALVVTNCTFEVQPDDGSASSGASFSISGGLVSCRMMDPTKLEHLFIAHSHFAVLDLLLSESLPSYGGLLHVLLFDSAATVKQVQLTSVEILACSVLIHHWGRSVRFSGGGICVHSSLLRPVVLRNVRMRSVRTQFASRAGIILDKAWLSGAMLHASTLTGMNLVNVEITRGSVNLRSHLDASVEGLLMYVTAGSRWTNVSVVDNELAITALVFPSFAASSRAIVKGAAVWADRSSPISSDLMNIYNFTCAELRVFIWYMDVRVDGGCLLVSSVDNSRISITRSKFEQVRLTLGSLDTVTRGAALFVHRDCRIISHCSHYLQLTDSAFAFVTEQSVLDSALGHVVEQRLFSTAMGTTSKQRSSGARFKI